MEHINRQQEKGVADGDLAEGNGTYSHPKGNGSQAENQMGKDGQGVEDDHGEMKDAYRIQPM